MIPGPWTALALLWLVGAALRMTILAVPPVIPVLGEEFHLSGTEIGILTGLPVVLFAAAALAGSRLVARLGAVAAILVGLVLTAAGSALRAGAADVITLLAATAVMAAGVAVTQPALPALVGRWLPRQIGLGTAVYTNGLLIGEIAPVALFPVLFHLTGQSWRATFVLWALPVAAIAAVVAIVARRQPAVRLESSPAWWPHWRLREILQIALVFGSASALYFGSNAFLPDRLSAVGRADLISPALTALNLGQLPASLLLMAFAHRLERRVWPFVAAGVLGLGAIGAIVATSNEAIVAAAAVLGFACGTAFALGLTLPPLLSAPADVARVSAAMFTISYATAVLVTVASGVVWDLTGVEWTAFLPIALSALPLILLAPAIQFDRRTKHGTQQA